MGVTVSKSAIERLPPAARGKACVCARCAAAGRTSEAAAETEPIVPSERR
jgi:hypothetical protein